LGYGRFHRHSPRVKKFFGSFFSKKNSYTCLLLDELLIYVRNEAGSFIRGMVYAMALAEGSGGFAAEAAGSGVA